MGYVIGRMFMNIYGMGVDTLLMCYIVDYEVNRSEGGPKSVPNTFKEYVSEYEWIVSLLYKKININIILYHSYSIYNGGTVKYLIFPKFQSFNIILAAVSKSGVPPLYNFPLAIAT